MKFKKESSVHVGSTKLGKAKGISWKHDGFQLGGHISALNLDSSKLAELFMNGIALAKSQRLPIQLKGLQNVWIESIHTAYTVNETLVATDVRFVAESEC